MPTQRPRIAILGSSLIEGQSIRGAEGSLLALLALQPGQIVTRAVLTNALWPLAAEGAARNRLKTYVWRLRKALTDTAEVAVESGADGYLLGIDPNEVDARMFRCYLSEADALVAAGGWTEGLQRIDEALELWRGRPLGQLDNPLAWVPEVAELTAAHDEALELRCEVMLRVGRARDAVSQLQELARSRPDRVNRWRLLIEALRASGRGVDALGVVDDARDALRAAGHTDPTGVIDELESSILANDPLTETTVVPRSGPRQPTTLFGREPHLAELDALWSHRPAATPQLVVLRGPAGGGASALAHEFAGTRGLSTGSVSDLARDQATGHDVIIVDALTTPLDRWVDTLATLRDQPVLLLLSATSPRHRHVSHLESAEATVGIASSIDVGPLTDKLLEHLADRLCDSPERRETVIGYSGGLPGLATEIGRLSADRVLSDQSEVAAIIDRWVNDLSPEDQHELAKIMTAGPIDVGQVAASPQALERIDLLDRARSRYLLVADTETSGLWRWATPLLEARLSATFSAEGAMMEI